MILDGYKRLLKSICCICGLTIEEIENLKIDDDLLKIALDKVISTLPDRHRKIIRIRYGLDDGILRTIDEVGNILNVSPERVRQIEMSAFRRLKNPGRFKFIRIVINGSTVDQMIFDQYDKIKELENTIELLRKRIKLIEQLIADVTLQLNNIALIDEPLETLNLSTRAYNCLCRANIKTIGDLIAMDSEKLFYIRNLGIKAYHEVAELANKVYGTSFATSDEDIEKMISDHQKQREMAKEEKKNETCDGKQ
jgi:hypothetical protein